MVPTVGGESGEGAYIKPLRCHQQNEFRIKMGSDVSYFNVAFIVQLKSRDSVHQSRILKRNVSRSGESNLRPSAETKSCYPLLGQCFTGSTRHLVSQPRGQSVT